VNIKPSFDTVSGFKLPLRPPPERECRHSNLACAVKTATCGTHQVPGMEREAVGGEKHMKARPSKQGFDSGGGQKLEQRARSVTLHVIVCSRFPPYETPRHVLGAGAKRSRTPVFFADWGLH
jgi:hypothetical protein